MLKASKRWLLKFKPAYCAKKQLGAHRLLGSKQGRVNVRSNVRTSHTSQSFKPSNNRLRIKSNTLVTSSSEVLRQASKCLAEKGCKKELGEKFVSAILKNEDQLESLEAGLCLKEIRGHRGQVHVFWMAFHVALCVLMLKVLFLCQ